MASDIHPEAQVDSVCAETENVTSTTDIKVNDTILDNDRQQHSKHKHHVHNCGTCHINLICADSTPPHINCLKAISYTLKFDQSVIEKNPLGIFRPPRG